MPAPVAGSVPPVLCAPPIGSLHGLIPWRGVLDDARAWSWPIDGRAADVRQASGGASVDGSTVMVTRDAPGRSRRSRWPRGPWNTGKQALEARKRTAPKIKHGARMSPMHIVLDYRQTLCSAILPGDGCVRMVHITLHLPWHEPELGRCGPHGHASSKKRQRFPRAELSLGHLLRWSGSRDVSATP